MQKIIQVNDFILFVFCKFKMRVDDVVTSPNRPPLS